MNDIALGSKYLFILDSSSLSKVFSFLDQVRSCPIGSFSDQGKTSLID